MSPPCYELFLTIADPVGLKLEVAPGISNVPTLLWVSCVSLICLFSHCITEKEQFQHSSILGELWSPARQQLWPWSRSRSRHGAKWKGLSQGSCMPNFNALSLILQKIWARLKILWWTDRWTDRQTEGWTDKWVLMSPRFRERRGTITRNEPDKTRHKPWSDFHSRSHLPFASLDPFTLYAILV